jgi:N-acetyl-gamma-glutamylphosphate reductase
LIELEGVVIDAKSGVTGAGRGGASAFGYAETNEDLFAYGLASHPHAPEIEPRSRSSPARKRASRSRRISRRCRAGCSRLAMRGRAMA